MSGALDVAEQALQAELRKSAPPGPTLRPGVGVTIYGNLPRDIAKPIVSAADFVTLHTAADATDVTSASRVRALGGSRVWLAMPSNYFVRLAAKRGERAAFDEATRCAKVAVAMGAEALEFNGEGSSDAAVPGDWVPASAEEAHTLAELAAGMLAAARAVCHPRGIAVLWTSHDMPSFRLPWGPILGGVDYHSPQHYPAEKGRLVPQRELMARVDRSRGRWEAMAERDAIPRSMLPGGERWIPYLQGWGHTPAATVWGLCEAPIARLWAYPGSWSPASIAALGAARRVRAQVGAGPDAIPRWQVAQGLVGDGVIGPKTLAALGLPA